MIDDSALHVAMVSDRAYLPWSATTIVSCARACTGVEVHIHLLHSPDVGSADQRVLASMAADIGVEMHFYGIDAHALDRLPPKGRMSWARVLMPQLLDVLERVLYLDGDTLVVDSLRALWELDLGDLPVAAVPNVTERSMYPHVRAVGVDDPDLYFNAGVLVVNLSQWRREAASDALVEFGLSRPHDVPWFDQDAMNAVFAGRWKRLHPRWNAMNSFWTWPNRAEAVFGAAAVAAAKADPGVLHFEGPSLSKPWHYLCDHPWRDQYRAMLGQTPWVGTPLVDRTAATRVIARLPRHRRLPAYRWLHRARHRVATVRGGG